MQAACGRPIVVPPLPVIDSEAGRTAIAAIVTLPPPRSSASHHQVPAAPPPWSKDTRCLLSASLPASLAQSWTKGADAEKPFKNSQFSLFVPFIEEELPARLAFSGLGVRKQD